MSNGESLSDAFSFHVDIKTKSLERILTPLITQVSTLVKARDRQLKSEKAAQDLTRVGEAIQMAVDRFVRAGESIAIENSDVREDMITACRDVRIAGGRIRMLTNAMVLSESCTSVPPDRASMVEAARMLLQSITRVLLIADTVTLKQLTLSSQQVIKSLSEIETCYNFSNFVPTFGNFGSSMVDFAKLSGLRQNDLKSTQCSSILSTSRSLLERCTTLLLTSTKTLLRYPNEPFAIQMRRSVVEQINFALNNIKIVSHGEDINLTTIYKNNEDSQKSNGVDNSTPEAIVAIKKFEDMVEGIKVTLVNKNVELSLQNALKSIITCVHEFTDSAITTHNDREQLLRIVEKIKHDLTMLNRTALNMSDQVTSRISQELDICIQKLAEDCRFLRKQLVNTLSDNASEVLRPSELYALIDELRILTRDGGNSFNESVERFKLSSDQFQEITRLLRHVSTNEQMCVWASHLEFITPLMAQMVIQSMRILSLHSNSKTASENVDAFASMWVAHIDDVVALCTDALDESKIGALKRTTKKRNCTSLPRLTKQPSGNNLQKGSNLSIEEKAQIEKAGIEMQLITSKMDIQMQKWTNPANGTNNSSFPSSCNVQPDLLATGTIANHSSNAENEIVNRAKNMSCMAFSIYLFTRGEGPLKTTQDLFCQVEFFAQESTGLYRAALRYSKQLPNCSQKNDLISALESVPKICETINKIISNPTVGKAATFNKVDEIIQQTKNLMNVIARVVTTCYLCSTEFTMKTNGKSDQKLSPSFYVTSSNSRDFMLDNLGTTSPLPTENFRRSLSLTNRGGRYPISEKL